MKMNPRTERIFEKASRYAHDYGFLSLNEEIVLYMMIGDETVKKNCERYGINFDVLEKKLSDNIINNLAIRHRSEYLEEFPYPKSIPYTERLHIIMEDIAKEVERRHRTHMTPFDFLIYMVSDKDSILNKLLKPKVKYDVTFETRTK